MNSYFLPVRTPLMCQKFLYHKLAYDTLFCCYPVSEPKTAYDILFCYCPVSEPKTVNLLFQPNLSFQVNLNGRALYPEKTYFYK